MNPDRIGRILNSGFRAVFAIAGGGSGALHELLGTPGASRFVVEAHVPYSPEALERFLGGRPEQAVSPAVACKLAEVAFRAQVFDSRFLAVGCTSALQTDRERRGEDRAFICIKTAEAEKLYAIFFSKASRAAQEALLSDWILVLIAQATGSERPLVFPGSFNPVHQGHFNLLKVAEKMTGLRGVFELSCVNVDKPPADESDCLCRTAAIRDIPVALTQAPRFVQKALLFPNTTFVLGFDTAVRLVAYARPGEWDQFKTLGSRFLVAGRLHNGRFESLENLNLPAGVESLFEAVPESKFREDISSTGLRNGINR